MVCISIQENVKNGQGRTGRKQTMFRMNTRALLCSLMIDNKKNSLYYIVSYRTKQEGAYAICV